MEFHEYSTLIKGCYFPYIPKDNPQAKYACGRCPNCLKRRIDHWAFRISKHLLHVKHAYFVTYTYALGQCDRSENGFLTLNPHHFRNYMKRVRKELGDNKDTPFNDRVKYIITGEYGTKKARPHYHAILLNVPYSVIEKHWPYGLVDIREIHSNRIAYLFKYCQKARVTKRIHDRDDRIAEYVNFSQGIGKQWLTDQTQHYHVTNINNPTITLSSGERISIPRYYKERIFTKEQREQIAENMSYIEDHNQQVIDSLDHQQQQELLAYKNEKIRLMNKKAKKDVN